MKSIDVKSLLIGVLSTVLVMVCIGAAGKPRPRFEVGRYVPIVTSKKVDMLDTATGSLYESFTDGITGGWARRLTLSDNYRIDD